MYISFQHQNTYWYFSYDDVTFSALPERFWWRSLDFEVGFLWRMTSVPLGDSFRLRRSLCLDDVELDGRI